MSKFLITLLVIGSFIAAAAAQPARDISLAPATPGKRLAAVVGNASYTSIPPLKNTLNDADSISAALRSLGFEVMNLRNASKSQFDQLLENFYLKLRGGQYETALFYYSGHGVSVFGRNYLVPIDARPLSEKDVEYSCLDANRVLSLMEDHAPVKILILDACRDNPFTRSWGGKGAGQTGLSSMSGPNGAFIGFAAAENAKASDGRKGNNGIYTAALLQHLRTPGLSIDQIFTRVAKTTQQLAGAEGWEQVPFKRSSLTEDFYFRFGEKQPEPPVVVEKGADPKPAVVPDHMVLVEGGWFNMGDTFGDGYGAPVHRVRVSTFLMGKYEVTFQEYDAFCEATGRSKPDDKGWGRESRPVVDISWFDAVDYCNWLSRQEGYRPVYTIKGENVSPDWNANGYRLPTEAEWEYAARQRGDKVRFGNGKDVADPMQINFDGNKDSKSYSIIGIDRQKTLPVGSLNSPNSLGLHDMSGNVSEWCWDWFGVEFYSSSPDEDPRGPLSGFTRVVRGGNWMDAPFVVRADCRGSGIPSGSSGIPGFRLVRTQ